MAYYPDNYDLDDDSDSIMLQELEPMTSSPYVHISLDPLPEKKTPASEREQRRRQLEADRKREAERERQRKAAAAAKKRRPPERQRPKAPEPSLHVIIERSSEEEPYSRYDGGYDDYDRYDRYDRYESAPIPEPVAAAPRYEAPRSSAGVQPREAATADLEREAAGFPRIPEGMMYRVDEPEPSAPPSVVLPNESAPARTVHGSSYPGASSESRAFRPQAVSSDIPMYFEGSVPADAERHPKIEPLGAASGAAAASGFIKRPWSESAFNDHASQATGRPAASATPQQKPSMQQKPAQAPAPAQPSKPTVPTVTLSGFGTASANPAPSEPLERSQMERRPFGMPEDPYATSRGMGSWKRNAAAEAMRRDQANNPRAMHPAGTVSIQMPSPASTPPASPAGMPSSHAEAGNIHLSHDSLNSMGIALPQQRQTTIRSFGSPSFEEGALKESVMFEEPPVSIADGMRSADKKRKRSRKLIIAVAAVVVAAACAVGVLSHNGIIDLGAVLSGSSSADSAISPGGAQTGSTGTSSSNGAAGTTSRSSSANDQSGIVIYEYTATTSDGVAYNVNDTVTYDAEGKCQTTNMKLDFPDEAACNDFLANLERDYGSAYQLDSQSGASATVTIDISALKFDREEYEDALRYSVEELTVLKK